MSLDQVTPLILTYNEEANLRRTLAALTWAKQVVVIDSFSTDSTPEICAEFDNTTVVDREYDNHTSKWNFGVDQVTTEWTLALDADYECPDRFPGEFETLDPATDVWFCNFAYCIFGKPLRATLYPPRAVLFRTRKFRYINDGHTQLLDVGTTTPRFIESRFRHDDRKSLPRWLNSQLRCAELEADKIEEPGRKLGWKDRIRQRIIFAPLLTVVYALIWKRLILDGWPGIYYTLQRVYAELLLSLILLDRKLRRLCGDDVKSKPKPPAVNSAPTTQQQTVDSE